jgi:TDG/mug DNA glycosylase family protein
MTTPRPQRPTREQLAAAEGTTVPDIIAPGLAVLFCGINPSLYSAVVGHHFARPGNRFWKALYGAGFTPHLFTPDEDRLLPAYGIGITNLVDRATAGEADLAPGELAAGRAGLEAKIHHYRPQAVAVLGMGAYRLAFSPPRTELGLQPEPIGTTRLWVLPNPSGLNAHYQLEELIRLYRALWEAVRG